MTTPTKRGQHDTRNGQGSTASRDELSKELGAIVRRFKQGYRLERTGGGHYRLRDRHGKLVTYVSGRSKGKNITLATNPSPGVLRAIEHDLTEARVLKGTTTRAISDEHRAARIEGLRAMQRARDEKRSAQAKQLHERLSYVLRHVGGLDVPGRAQELGDVGVVFAREQGKPMTPDLLASSARRVIQGAWVEDRYTEVWNALAERLEAAPEPGGEWYSLIREVRDLPADTVKLRAPKDEEWPFRVELLPLENLFADETYQRPVAWTFVRREAARFDPALVGTIDVAQRSPSRFAILDGQQRREIVLLVGKTTIWASVYVGLDLASEARFFLHKNRDRKSVHPYYTFRARLASEDQAAIEIDKLVTKYGYKLAIGAPRTGAEDHIAAIAAIEAAHERFHAESEEPTLDAVLALLKRSTFGRPHGQNSVLIRGLSRIYWQNTQVDDDKLAEVLVSIGPELILGRARDLARNSGGNAEFAVAKVLIAEYDKRLPRDQRLGGKR